jgi:hypothetical protein
MSIQSAHVGDNVVSIDTTSDLTPKTTHLVLISVGGWVDSRTIAKESVFVPSNFRPVVLCTGITVTTTNLSSKGLNVLETAEDGYVIFAWNMEQIRSSSETFACNYRSRMQVSVRWSGYRLLQTRPLSVMNFQAWLFYTCVKYIHLCCKPTNS